MFFKGVIDNIQSLSVAFHLLPAIAFPLMLMLPMLLSQMVISINIRAGLKKTCTHFYIFFHKLATDMTLDADETQITSDSNSVILLDF